MGTLAKKTPKSYGFRTSTTMLRYHLFKSHADEWVEACDKMKIAIGGREGSSFEAKLDAFDGAGI